MSGVKNANGDEGKKPIAACDSEKRPTDVNLKVKNQKFKTMHFRMRRNTPLQELFDVYTRKHEILNFIFIYEGKRINPRLTALQSGMKDGDEIDAMFNVTGGGGGRSTSLVEKYHQKQQENQVDVL